MMARYLTAVSILFVALAPTACGGDDGNGDGGVGNGDGGVGGDSLTCDPTFGDVAEACGGDPVGSWTVVEACSDFDFAGSIQDQCAGATQESLEYQPSGTVDITSSAFDLSVQGTVSGVVAIPQDCVINNCMFTGNLVDAVLTDGSASCADDNPDGCLCEAETTAELASVGTYTTDGGVATIDNADMDEWYYCVSGDSMLLRKKTGDDPRPTFLLERQ